MTVTITINITITTPCYHRHRQNELHIQHLDLGPPEVVCPENWLATNFPLRPTSQAASIACLPPPQTPLLENLKLGQMIEIQKFSLDGMLSNILRQILVQWISAVFGIFAEFSYSVILASCQCISQLWNFNSKKCTHQIILRQLADQKLQNNYCYLDTWILCYSLSVCSSKSWIPYFKCALIFEDQSTFEEWKYGCMEASTESNANNNNTKK